MATLADMASGTIPDRQAYTAYVIACQESGKTALKFADWVAAGKPGA